ncbi:MAG TPA: M48 family metalloprotease, partial [Acidimicrobiales bacterium]|nr:M48 family metalloprotease [Acidimicrobiales bacterium]
MTDSPYARAAASVAAGLAVLASLQLRLPAQLLRVTGVRGWIVPLVGVMAMVNGARVMVQAPFTFAAQDEPVPTWLAGQIKQLGATVVVGAALTVPLYALLRAGGAWWLWAWLLFAVVTAAAQVAMPLIVRLQTGALSPAPAVLAEQVDMVAGRAGVSLPGGTLVADRGRGRGPRCNAFVVGLGPTRHVILESGVAAWPADLVEQVVAHEIGHCRLRHTARRLVVTLFVQLATLAGAAAVLAYRPLLAWAGIARLGDPRSYPLLLLLTPLLVLPARMALAAYDRAQERQADRFAVALLGDEDRFAAMLDRAA